MSSATVLIAPQLVLAAESAADVSAVVVAGRRLDDAVARLQDTGAGTVIRIDRDHLLTDPGGMSGALGLRLIRTPSVSFDALGRETLRGQHDAVEYRINGVALPQGAEGFGDLLNGRFADRVEFVTGALPARFGPSGGGVVQVTPRSPPYEPGGAVDVYGGGEGAANLGGEVSGNAQGTDFFGSIDTGTDQRGVDGPTPADRPLHDRSGRTRLFAFLSGDLDETSRWSLIAGFSEATRQAPNVAGLQPGLGLTVFNKSLYPSANINDSQVEQTSFTSASWLYSAGRLDLEASAYVRLTQLSYRGDRTADLLYTGLGQRSRRLDRSAGVQVDGVWRLAGSHQIGFGLNMRSNQAQTFSNSLVLRLTADNVVINDAPAAIIDYQARDGHLLGIYLQDDWKLTDQLRLNYGVRLDHQSAVAKASAISPRASIVWEPAASVRLRLGYAHGFTPSPDQRANQHSVRIFFATTATSFSTRNDPPLPEESDEVDLAADYRLGEHWVFMLNGYEKTAKNLLDEGQFAAPLVTVPFNYARGRLSGLEARATWRAGPWQAWLAASNSSAQGSHIISAQYNFSAATLNYVAHHWIALDANEKFTGASGLEWRGKDTSLSAQATYGSGPAISRKHPNDATLDPRLVVNLSAVRGFDLPAPFGAIDLRLDVFNILDRSYQLRDGTSLTLGGRQYGPRRQFFFGVVRSF